jgi:hypothetical protein
MRVAACARDFPDTHRLLADVRPLIRSLLTLALLLLAGSAPALAANGATRTVTYRGYRLTIPSSWPVFNLALRPRTCVRFDRHALYLGRPSGEQDCPPVALGRTEAILLEPLRGGQRAALGAAPASAAAQPAGGSLAQLRIRGRRLLITATWGRDPALLRAVLHDQAIGRERAGGGEGASSPTFAPRAAATTRAAAATTRSAAMTTRAATARGAHPAARSARAHAAASTYTGLGFDACSAPSSSQLADWQSSPFHAYGIYIGGANMACAQPNLSSAYVAQEVAAGWHLIPTYVGLQAPGNSCACAAISPSQATAEGTAAAQDAVADAQALGIETGNPIYFDMEAYDRTSTASQAVLNFLAAWTAELHSQGYLSGVYVADNSGVPDLVSQWGSGYLEPDELWIASWNGQQSTYDSEVPSSEWASHQRIHQYRGGHNDTYGGATINIDSDYVDAATVGAGGVTGAAASAPTLSISPQPSGTITLHASWTGMGAVAGWRLYGGDSPQSLEPLSGVLRTGLMSSRDAFAYFAAQALNASGQVLGLSAVTPTPAHLALYGASVFVPAHAGGAGIPVGCFTGAACHVRVTVSAGRALIAASRPQRLGAGGGLVGFMPSAAGRRLLDAGRNRRLAVTITVLDSSGVKASRRMTLVAFSDGGRAPARSSSPAAAVRAVGGTDFVSSAGTGGILAACTQPAPCAVSAQLSFGRTTIASTGREWIGAHQLSYVIFHLSGRGRALMAAAAGNQLPVSVVLSDAGALARARIALVGFS